MVQALRILAINPRIQVERVTQEFFIPDGEVAVERETKQDRGRWLQEGGEGREQGDKTRDLLL